MKLIDLTGKQFGRFTVVGRGRKTTRSHNTYWNVRCVCGTTKEVTKSSLIRGKAKSCGCLRRDLGTWNKGITGKNSHTFKGAGEIPLSYVNELKRKARTRGLTWTISIEFLSELFDKQSKCCAISGIPLVMPRMEVINNCASLDRKDSSKGYTEDNVQWVDRRINFMKSRMEDQEFIKMCKIVAKYNND